MTNFTNDLIPWKIGNILFSARIGLDVNHNDLLSSNIHLYSVIFYGQSLIYVIDCT